MATYFCCSSSPEIQVSCIINFVISFLLLLPLSESVYFNITRFDDDASNILYSGYAMASLSHVGQAVYADSILMWDKKSGKVSDFTTHITLITNMQTPPSSCEGIAFFLAPSGFQTPRSSADGFQGLFNTTDTDPPQDHMIGIQLNCLLYHQWEPPYKDVGINKSSISSSNLTSWNASLHSGERGHVWVSYNASTQILNVSWSYGAKKNTSLLRNFDLREILPERVTVGFSATTDTDVERQVIKYWEFNSTLNIEDNLKERKLAVELTIPLGVLVLGGMVACSIFWRRRKPAQNSLETVSLISMTNHFEKGAGPKRFCYRDLASATNNFSSDRKLGEGGFGCVYKGYLSREAMVVAVKKNSESSKQGKNEYITEVKIISRLRHRNLVQLIGWCHDHTQFLLVYEFMPNGSLDSHLFGKKSPLEWAVRYNIALGLASALLYLHEEWEQCVLHRDIKTSNIMLDKGFNVKLGDFGLARLRDHELGSQTTGLAGTLGYLAPEYVMTGRASKESDVYSFGVVALEIACGRKATGSIDPDSYLGLVKWVWDLLGKGELLSGVDRKLNNIFDAKQVECLMKVGLWCAHPDRSLRPSIRQAIQVLMFEGGVPNLPAQMPVPMYYTAPDATAVASEALL